MSSSTKNTILMDCNFVNNTVNRGGGMATSGTNNTFIRCNFINNKGNWYGGGVCWWGKNGNIINSKFTNNTALSNKGGGGVYWSGANGTLTGCNFINNIANVIGGAISWQSTGSIVNCSFINSKSQKINGIYTDKNLNINNGKGIVYVETTTTVTLSGITIVALNNQTYFCPPNENINFIYKKL